MKTNLFNFHTILFSVGFASLFNQYYLVFMSFKASGVHSSVVEHLTADQEVTGSNPVGPFFVV